MSPRPPLLPRCNSSTPSKEVSSFSTMTYDGCAPVAVSRDGKLIATSGEDASVHVREMESGKTIYEKRECACMRLQFSDDGKVLVGSSGFEDEIFIWSLNSWERRSIKTAQFCGFGALSKDGRFAISTTDGTLISIETGKAVFPTLRETQHASACAFSPDSKRFVIASDTALTAWNIETPEAPQK